MKAGHSESTEWETEESGIDMSFNMDTPLESGLPTKHVGHPTACGNILSKLALVFHKMIKLQEHFLVVVY